MPRFLIVLILALTAASPAAAYVGPGLGLGVVATFLGTVSAIFLSLFGLVWFPLKRFAKRIMGRADDGVSSRRLRPSED